MKTQIQILLYITENWYVAIHLRVWRRCALLIISDEKAKIPQRYVNIMGQQ